MKRGLCVLLIGLCFLFSACTEPGETTGVAAATGGVIGAGLGAIIGNQTGDAGSGMLIGAVAGAGTGAAIGNALQAQEEAIRTQDEAMERQERLISKQQEEINELRRINRDQLTLNNSVSNTEERFSVKNKEMLERGAMANAARLPADASAGSISEKTIVEPASKSAALSSGYFRGSNQPVEPQFQAQNATEDSAARSAYDWKSSPDTAQMKSLDSNEAESPQNGGSELAVSDDCAEAAKEVKSAQSSPALADRLFHYRRALRLCPSQPEYHNGIGEVYMSLNRISDAEFEFREALKLDPSFAPARNNLQSLSGNTY